MNGVQGWWLAREIDAGEPELLRSTLRMLAEALLSAEADELCGASFGRRSPDRKDHRNGRRTVRWRTGLGAVGTIELQVPKLRKTTYDPPWLHTGEEHGRLLAAVAAASLVTAPDLGHLVERLGSHIRLDTHLTAISDLLAAHAEAFRTRPLGPTPGVSLRLSPGPDPILLVAGTDDDGDRRILAAAPGDRETLLRSLAVRGLTGVATVDSLPGDGLRELVHRAWPAATSRLLPGPPSGHRGPPISSPEPVPVPLFAPSSEASGAATAAPAPSTASVASITSGASMAGLFATSDRPVTAEVEAIPEAADMERVITPDVPGTEAKSAPRRRLLRAFGYVGLGALLAAALVLMRPESGHAVVFGTSLAVAFAAVGIMAWKIGGNRPEASPTYRAGATMAAPAVPPSQAPAEADDSVLTGLGVTWATEAAPSKGLGARMARKAPRGVLIAGAAVAWLGLTAAGIKIMMTPADYDGPGGRGTVVQIVSDASLPRIGQALKRRGVVASSDAFLAALGTRELKPGFYRVHQGLPAEAAVNLLLDQQNRVRPRVTVPPGLRLGATLAYLSKKTKIPLSDFQDAVKQTHRLRLPPYAKGKVEGFLYPGTYVLQPGETALSLLASMVESFTDVAARVGLDRAAKPRNALVVASLVQAEGGRKSDQRRMARKIYQRLREHRRVKLPTGPITNPGRAALQAALQPVNPDES